MNLYNMEIREQIEKKRLRYFEVAEAIGIRPTTLSHWLQTPLNEERKARLIKAIEDFKL